ncbi:MAG: hypothetical protein ACAH95_06610 [Fimbriimonas sp.]
MKRTVLFLVALCLTAATPAQDKPIPWDDFDKAIEAMQVRVETMMGEIGKVSLQTYADETKVQDKHGWLSAWSGGLYLDANKARDFHGFHREVLYETGRWSTNRPKLVQARYFEYYKKGMRELEATHLQILTAFKEYARAIVGEIVAYEKGGREAMNEAEKVTKSLKDGWKKHQTKVCFEPNIIEGAIPEPRVLGIGTIKIDYANWHAERMGSNEGLSRVKRSIEARTKDIDAKVAEIRAMNGEIDALQATYQQKLKAQMEAEWVARNGPRQLTNPAIRDTERAHSAAIAELARVDAQLRTAKGTTKRSLQSKQRQLRTQRDRAKSRVSMLKEDLVEDAKADAQAALTRITNERYDALKPLARAESERNIRVGVLETMQQGYQTDIEEHDRLIALLGKLGSEAPVITLVKASGFEAKLWEPEDVLRDLDADIAATQAMLREFDDKRRTKRQEMLEWSEEVTRKSQALAASQWGSMMAQFGVEVVFAAADLAKAAKEGPAGVLAEASKKLVENALFGVSYADPNNLIPESDTFLDTASDLLPDGWATKDSGKRLVKSGITGYSTSYALSSYLASQARQDYEGVAQRMARLTWMDDEAVFVAANRRNFQVAPLLAEHKKALVEAEKNLAKMGTWKNYLKKGGSSFFVGKIKDLTKGAAKQALANMIEGEAWQDHKAAELEYRSRVLLLYQASNMYWKSHDALEHLRSLRRSLLDQYDPGSSMKVSNRGSLADDEDLMIELSDRGSDAHRPSNREVDLFFGDVKAERLSGGRLIFKVTAAKLQAMPVAAHPIRIVVRG